MTTAFLRRYYAGGGTTTTLATGMGSGDTSFTISAATGWPGTPGVDFGVVIDRGTANEEKILCSQNVSTTVTVDTGGRGADGTSAVSHAAGATVSLCWLALDADESNQISYLLGNGTSGQVLVAAGASTIPAWSTADAAGIVDKTTVQTMTNKTLTAPKIATIVNTGTLTLPTSTDTLVGRATTDTLTNKTVSGPLITQTVTAVTVTTNAGTVPVTAGSWTFTNSSSATMAITMATAGAVDGQRSIGRIYDFAGTGETIGWTNTENGGASVPTTSNGSTTLPKFVEFIFNGATSKWRCVVSA